MRHPRYPSPTPSVVVVKKARPEPDAHRTYTIPPGKMLKSDSSQLALQPITTPLLNVLTHIAEGRGARLRVALRTQNADATRYVKQHLRDAGLVNAEPGPYAFVDLLHPVTTKGLALLAEGDEQAARASLPSPDPQFWLLP